MKKTFLKCLTVIALLSFAATVFAATPSAAYRAEIAPTAELLSKHKLLKGPNQGTDIIVINYTENTIGVCTPFSCNMPTRLTSVRITDNSTAYMPITLSDAGNGSVFWSDSVPNYATVSVYVSNGKYVVYVTRN